MTDLTDDQVQALLDGATPGPWRADGEPWNRIVWSSADNRVCFMAHSSGLNDARDIATSNLVAAAPDLARALLDARAKLAQPRADTEALSDPNAVHINMLHGTVAKPTLDQIVHLYGVDALCKALAPLIEREAGNEPA
jgi:hypothetical protein